VRRAADGREYKKEAQVRRAAVSTPSSCEMVFLAGNFPNVVLLPEKETAVSTSKSIRSCEAQVLYVQEYHTYTLYSVRGTHQEVCTGLIEGIVRPSVRACRVCRAT
jgi:hypothetical protein